VSEPWRLWCRRRPCDRTSGIARELAFCQFALVLRRGALAFVLRICSSRASHRKFIVSRKHHCLHLRQPAASSSVEQGFFCPEQINFWQPVALIWLRVRGRRARQRLGSLRAAARSQVLAPSRQRADLSAGTESWPLISGNLLQAVPLNKVFFVLNTYILVHTHFIDTSHGKYA